jgi:uncharacterized repeat protein (TIGR02543 family)
MKTLLPSTIITLLAAASLFGAAPPLQAVDSSQTPKGLSGSDWSDIRGAYEKNRHAIVANADGSHQARNPGQAWLTKFDGRGFTVTPDAGGWTWGLELAGFGDVTEVRQDEGKVSYSREDGLTEWFVNDARGLEQGWTLSKRPERAGIAGPVRLDLTVRGGLRPQVSPEGASVAFLNESGGTALTYGGLKAWDADGKTVQVRFAEGEGVEKGLRVVVNDTGARYPITVDPIAQQAYLKASNTGANDAFGASVAVSGNTVVVGAPNEDSGSTGINGNGADNSAESAGAVYVFVRNGTIWSQQAYLKASNAEAHDSFGLSLSISGDTIVVGAMQEDGGGTLNGDQADNTAPDAGAAYVFVRNGTSWSQQAYLKASNADANDQFGLSVSISGDAVLVGAWQEASAATTVNGNQADNSGYGTGAAYIFARDGGVWSQQAYLKASEVSIKYFGYSVAISGDTAVVGLVGADDPYACVFCRSGATWTQQGSLEAAEVGIRPYGPTAVAVAGDTVVVGASFVNGSTGAAYVFARNGNTWAQQAVLGASNPKPGISQQFGASVGVSGNVVVVGAHFDDSNSIGVNGDQNNSSSWGAGAAYVFSRIGVSWNQIAYLKASNTEPVYSAGTGVDNFGGAVAVSDGTVVVGASNEDSNATGANGNQADNAALGSGAAYVFDGVLYMLSTSATNGSVLGGGGYVPGSSVNVVATPNPGYLFSGWIGDYTGSDNPIAIVMDSNKAITANFSQDTRDTDDDGLTNYQEIVELGTDPTLKDTDGDNVEDGDDAFPLNISEWLDTDHDGNGDNADLDDDGDGLPDVDEINTYGTNSKRADSDGDGLSDPAELQTHLTNPNLADTDSDGLSDGAEVNTYGTLPKVADTDLDGFLDGYEVQTGKSPLNILDKPALVAEARTAIEFTFPSALGKTYRIEDSTDLAAWGTVESGITGNGGQIQRFYSTRSMPKRYFRVEEDAP